MGKETRCFIPLYCNHPPDVHTIYVTISLIAIAPINTHFASEVIERVHLTTK